MSAAPSSAPSTQPWKAHWCPTDNASEAAGHKYLIDDAGALLIDGMHNCASAGDFCELARAHNEAESSKAQPWKAHWSPANKAPESAVTKYMIDDAGALLIDGAHNCASAGDFCELAGARKKAESSKAQPWKAHWSPAKVVPETADTKYLVDDTGALIIDGFSGGHGWGELACAGKKEE